MSSQKMNLSLKKIIVDLQNGKFSDCFNRLHEIEGFESIKASVIAEIKYFEGHDLEAIKFDELALGSELIWSYSDVFANHLKAFVFVNKTNKKESYCQDFLQKLMLIIKDKGLPQHRYNFFNVQITTALNYLTNDLKFSPPEIILKGLNKEEFGALLKEKRPKLNINTPEAADFLLGYLFNKGVTLQVLEYYSLYSDNLVNYNHHIQASRYYLTLNQIEHAQKALKKYVLRWLPLQEIQALPMSIFEFWDLHVLLNPSFRQELFNTLCE